MPSGSCTGPFGKRRTSRTSSRTDLRRPASRRPENKRALDSAQIDRSVELGPVTGCRSESGHSSGA